LEDFNALAMSLAAGMADVRGCLILSGDGLVLGAHPGEAERTYGALQAQARELLAKNTVSS